MMKTVNLGVVCLARKTFDYEAAAEIFTALKKELKSIPNVEWSIIDELVIETEDAKKAADYLRKKCVDGLIIISGTFHLGHLALELNKSINCPILLWGLDELPYNGGKIRLNSDCGVNLNASNLYKSGCRNYHVVLGNKVDIDWISAIRVKKALFDSRIGLVGAHAHGFFNLDIDELCTYRTTGVLTDHFELDDIFNFNAAEELVNEAKANIASIFDTSMITEFQLKKVAELSVKIEGFIKENNLSALAIRCWPEFAKTFGISPCAAMSYLQSKGIILGCEGDIEGVMSMIAHQAVGAETPFIADLSQVNLKENFALLWHCGVAPCNLWNGKCNRSLDTYFAGGKGVTADFVMKEGEFSILRLDSSNNEYRLFLEKGQAQYMDKDLKGTYLKGVFDKPIQEIMDKVISNGIAHHISVVYGDYIKPFEILAKINGWKVV